MGNELIRFLLRHVGSAYILVKLSSFRWQVFSLTVYTAETNLARQLNSFASIISFASIVKLPGLFTLNEYAYSRIKKSASYTG